MSVEFLKSINAPIIFNALGFLQLHDADYTVAVKKFTLFLEYILHKKNTIVAIRNDGSAEQLQYLISDDDFKRVIHIPDSAFFFNPHFSKKMNNKLTIGICLSNDLFNVDYTNGITSEKFNIQISGMIQELIKKGYDIMLIPHTPQDLDVVHRIYSILDKRFFRYSVRIAPYGPYDKEDAIVYSKFYNKCDVIIGMRFHSCILAIDNRIPVIGLDGYGKVRGLYNELGLDAYCVSVGDDDYIDRIIKLMEIFIRNDSDYWKIIDQDYVMMNNQYNNYIKRVVDIICS